MSTTISPFQNTNSGYNYTTLGGVGTGVGTITNTSWQNPNPAMTVGQAGCLELQGDAADLVINGVSLSATLKGIQDRLNILQPNSALEAEWDQLQELGKQYRKLEAALLEKQRAWDILKKNE